MLCCFFLCNGDVSSQFRFTGKAVLSLDSVGRFAVQCHVLPREETMQLAVVLSPSSCLHHQIGRMFPFFLIFRQLSQYRPVFRQCGITDKKFDKERFVFSCLRILCRKGVPPPVISMPCQRPVQHTGISCYIMMIEHFLFSSY